MKTRGKIVLRLNIGGVESNQEFILVDNLFPSVIIGIWTMKDMGMKLNLNEDKAEIDNKIVLFIEKDGKLTPIFFAGTGLELLTRSIVGRNLV